MRIRGFQCTNWMTHAHLELPFTPLTIIAGGNDAGKTSVADGMSFALLGGLPRVYAKSDRHMLVRDGADKGVVQLLAGENWSVTRSITTGQLKTNGTHPQENEAIEPAALPFLFDPAMFAAEDPDTKRQLLMALAEGGAITRAKVVDTLKARKHDPAKVDLLPDVTFPEMVDFCKTKAAEYRGEWRGAAGRVYGDKVAADWEAPAPEPAGDAEALYAAYQTALTEANARRADLALIDSGNATTTAQNARLEELRTLAGNLATHEATLAEIEAEVLPDVETFRRSVAVLDGADDTELACPSCGTMLVLVDGALEHSVKPATMPSAAEQKRLRDGLIEAEAAVKDHATRKQNVAGLIEQSKASQAALDQLESVQGASAKPTLSRDAANGKVAEAVQAELTAQRAWEAARDAAKAIKEATEKTAKAKAAHAAVQAWVAIATQLEPGGIPGELLEATMKPFNEDLRALAGGIGWPQAAIRPDMAVTSGGRLYNLVSESRKWRTDAMIAVMLAMRSKAKFVVLDRFDVLEVPDRKPALEWLYKLTKAGKLDTVLIVGTFKAPPAVPKDVAVHWLGKAAA